MPRCVLPELRSRLAGTEPCALTFARPTRAGGPGRLWNGCGNRCTPSVVRTRPLTRPARAAMRPRKSGEPSERARSWTEAAQRGSLAANAAAVETGHQGNHRDPRVTWQAHRVKTLRVGKWSSRRDDRPRSVSGTAARTQHATPTPLVDRPTAPRHLPTPPCPPLHCSPLVAGRSSAGPSSAGPSSPRPRRDPGDPLWPGREGIQRQNELDESTWDGDGAPAFPGGLHYADDTARIFLQGSTQYDALGHVWYDGKLWNGYDARSTIGAMEKASVLPIAEKGIVGRACATDNAEPSSTSAPHSRSSTAPERPSTPRRSADGCLRREALAGPIGPGPASGITVEFGSAPDMFQAAVERDPDGEIIRYFDAASPCTSSTGSRAGSPPVSPTPASGRAAG